MADVFDLSQNPLPAARPERDLLARLLSTPGLDARTLFAPSQPPVDTAPPPRNPDFGRPLKLTRAGDVEANSPAGVAVAPAPKLAIPSSEPMPSAQDMGTARKAIPLPTYAPPNGIDQPIALNDPRYKPSQARSILGAVSTALMTYGRVPNAQEIGERAMNAPRLNAEADRQAKLAQYERGYKSNLETYHNSLAQNADERAQQSADALSSERAAKASKYENAIDPKSIMQGEDGKWYGTSYGDPSKRVEVAEPAYAAKLNSDETKRGNLIDQRMKEADKMGLTGDDKKFYVANGKLKEDGLTEYQRRELNLRERELNKKGEGKDKPKGPIPPNVARLMNTAKDNAIKDARGQFEAGQITKDDYLTLWQQAQDKFEQDITNAGYDPGEHFVVKDNVDERLMPKKAGSTPAPAPAAPVQKPVTPVSTPPTAKKTASPALVRQYAKSKGISYQTALAGFKSQGYEVTGGQ